MAQPTANGFYHYREKEPTIVLFSDGVPTPPDTIPGLPVPIVYFAKSSTPVELSTLAGEFCGPIVLPE